MSSIWSNDLEPTSVIRPATVLAAREAVARGAYDAPEIWDESLDRMIDRAESEERMRQAFEELADQEMQRLCETDR